MNGQRCRHLVRGLSGSGSLGDRRSLLCTQDVCHEDLSDDRGSLLRSQVVSSSSTDDPGRKTLDEGRKVKVGHVSFEFPVRFFEGFFTQDFGSFQECSKLEVLDCPLVCQGLFPCLRQMNQFGFARVLGLGELHTRDHGGEEFLYPPA